MESPCHVVYVCFQVDDLVVLVCEVNKDNTKAKWLKDGNELQTTNRFRVSKDGRKHMLEIHDVTLDDEAQYVCKVCI